MSKILFVAMACLVAVHAFPTTLTFSENTTSVLRTPGRGFYYDYSWKPSTGTPINAADLRSDLLGYTEGITIMLTQYVMSQFYQSDTLSSTFLTLVTNDLQAIRNAGAMTLLRFKYTNDDKNDATPARARNHVNQLGPIIAAQKDIILGIQCGIVGRWGEFYYSNNFGDESVAPLTTQNINDRKSIFEAWVNSTSSCCQVMARTPMIKKYMYTTPVQSAAAAFPTPLTRSGNAMIGHHNDCFLASADDEGTYSSNADRTYLAQDTNYVLLGGETCGTDGSHSACPNALVEMAAYHWTYLNRFYNQLNLDQWSAGGCYATIVRQLGYRFYISGVTMDGANGVYSVSLSVSNVGFAAPSFGVRWTVMLQRGTTSYTKVLMGTAAAVDGRLIAGNSVATISDTVTIPASAPTGTYNVCVSAWVNGSSLWNSIYYAIPLANQGKDVIYNSTSGFHCIPSLAFTYTLSGTTPPTTTTGISTLSPTTSTPSPTTTTTTKPTTTTTTTKATTTTTPAPTTTTTKATTTTTPAPTTTTTKATTTTTTKATTTTTKATTTTTPAPTTTTTKATTTTTPAPTTTSTKATTTPSPTSSTSTTTSTTTKATITPSPTTTSTASTTTTKATTTPSPTTSTTTTTKTTTKATTTTPAPTTTTPAPTTPAPTTTTTTATKATTTTTKATTTPAPTTTTTTAAPTTKATTTTTPSPTIVSTTTPSPTTFKSITTISTNSPTTSTPSPTASATTTKATTTPSTTTKVTTTTTKATTTTAAPTSRPTTTPAPTKASPTPLATKMPTERPATASPTAMPIDTTSPTKNGNGGVDGPTTTTSKSDIVTDSSNSTTTARNSPLAQEAGEGVLSKNALLGIIIGAVVLCCLLLLVGIICIVRKRKQNSQPKNRRQLSRGSYKAGMGTGSASRRSRQSRSEMRPAPTVGVPYGISPTPYYAGATVEPSSHYSSISNTGLTMNRNSTREFNRNGTFNRSSGRGY